MKTIKPLFAIIAMTLLIFCSSSKKPSIDISVDNNDLNLIVDFEEKLKKDGIAEYGIWKVGQKPTERLFYLIKNQIQTDKSDGEALSIFDNNKKLIYQESATSFDAIEIFGILRQSRSQMIIKSINYGGSGRFFKILDYKDNKIITLTNEDDNLYSGDVTIFPQYQEEKYYSLPYQVFLTENLVSTDATATVLRYVDGKYVSVGKLNQTEVGTFIANHTVKFNE